MKIEFEFTASYKARLKVDGKEIDLHNMGGMWEFDGLTEEELQNTFGGIVLQEIESVLINIMQAWCTVDDEQADTWTVLREDVAEKVASEIW